MISYFDCAATTKPTEQVIKDIETGMRDYWFNPSSTSEESRKVKLQIEHARRQVADFINSKPEEIIFTSGATESNNLAIKGTYDNLDFFGLFCSKIEHPSVYNTVKNINIDFGYGDNNLPVTTGGQIELDELNKKLYDNKLLGSSKLHPLVCISYVNNEIGSIQNICEISKLVHQYNGYLLVDATQAIEYKDIDVQGMGIDMLSASFHKFGGVRGCGFLYIKQGINLYPQITGGHQENNLRAGTEPNYLITAMGNRLEEIKKTKDLRMKIINEINWSIKKKLGLIDGNKIIEGIKQNGENCSPHIISLTIPNIPAQELITLMDLDGVIVSAGSACSSGENIPSRVLKAIGLTDDEARSTIRISFDEYTTEKDVENLINSLTKNVQILKELHMDDKE